MHAPAPISPPSLSAIPQVRTVQAFSIIGGVVKILGTVSFVSGRFAARTAAQALALLDRGRLLNVSFLLCNLLGENGGGKGQGGSEEWLSFLGCLTLVPLPQRLPMTAESQQREGS